MFEPIKKILTANTILLIIISLLILVIGPHITLAGSAPFSSLSTRLFLISSIFVVLGLKIGIEKLNSQKGDIVNQIKNRVLSSSSNMLSRCRQRVGQFKSGQLNCRDLLDQYHHRRRMQKLPWYLVLGPSQSGKKQLMAKSSLRFLTETQFGKESGQYKKQFPEYSWWLSHEAVFIGCENPDKEVEAINLRKFVRFLRKNRKNKPINGIIITYPISELLLAQNDKRQQQLIDLSQKIKQLHRGCHSQLPVYLVLTQCDMVAGFSEFFNDLSQEELSQIWGITLPYCKENNLNTTLDNVTTEFSNLILRLQQRVLWALDIDKQLRGRELIFTFPQQMQLFKKPITTIISELYTHVQQDAAFHFRGVYFTSAQQGTQPFDFLKAAIGKRFNLSHQLVSPTTPREESYFMSQLFHDVILKEGLVLGDSKRTQRLKRWLYKSCVFGLPIVFIAGITVMEQGYQQQSGLLQTLKQQHQIYLTHENQIQIDNPNFKAILPALGDLENSLSTVAQQSWETNLYYSHFSLNNVIHKALTRELNVLMLPRVAAHLESTLSDAQSDNTNNLYAILKAYLAFSPSNYTQPYAIIAPMEYQWSKQFHRDQTIHNQLSQLLKLSAQQRLPQLPLNRPLINKVRLKLQQIIPADRAYGLLTFKAAASDNASIDFAGLIGNGYPMVFSSYKTHEYIDSLYTLNGFQKIFLPQQSMIALQVANDNKEIGLTVSTTESISQIKSQLSTQYATHYVANWNNALQNIAIKKPNSLKQAITMLTILSSSHSPLKQLLDILEQNTGQVNAQQVQVSAHFKSINQYTDNLASKATYEKSVQIIRQLNQKLITLHESPDVNKSCYTTAKRIISGNASEPLIQLASLAATAPQPVKRWLNHIVNNTWEQLSQHAMRYLNDRWQSQVVSYYSNHIAHRYPVYRLSHQDISINDFSAFFNPHGVLSQYFNQMLKPFINTDKKQWKSYHSHGMALPLKLATVELFQKANRIADTYFAGSTKPTVQLTLRPYTLSRLASTIDLNAGDNAVNYAHGPRNSIVIDWPYQTDSKDTSITLTDFNQQHYNVNATGTWSLFRVLTNPHCKLYQNHNDNLLSIGLNHMHASFSIDSALSNDKLKLKPLQHFRLPGSL